MPLSNDSISAALSNAIAEHGLIRQEDTALIFYDLSWLQGRISELKDLFPVSTLHAIAVKANPLVRVLEKVHTLGTGLEAASLPELCLAQKAGAPSHAIVFDSPAKTMQELEYALRAGVHINADSLAELDRINTLLKTIPMRGSLGIRINPQVGSGSIPMLSVAGAYSKFGVPIKSSRQVLLDSFLQYEWLSGVHLHVGSQGCAIKLIAKGIERVLDFVHEANHLLAKSGTKRRIEIVDIGGGLPVSYYPEKKAVSMAEYRALLLRRFPELFDGSFKLVTEFGRWVYAHSGWSASRVEYVKREEKVNTAIIHLGADLLLRKCYRPEEWHHQISVAGRDGHLKQGRDVKPYVIAGPLCFGGDVIASEVILPVVEEGDYIIIHDTGAYTLSMWSRYNSRQIPQVIGYYGEGERIEVLRERETLEKVVEFWS